MNKLSKKPIVMAILTLIFTAAIFIGLVYLITLILGKSFADEFGTTMIVMCCVVSVVHAVFGYFKSRRKVKRG